MDNDKKKKKKLNPDGTPMDPLDELLQGGGDGEDALDAMLRNPTPAPPQSPVPPKSEKEPAQAPAPAPKRKKSGDLLRDIPPELAGLISSPVAERPVSRPVLWGQNKDASKSKELNMKFESTEREVIDELDDVPLVTLELLGQPKKKKKKKGDLDED